jgi:hypothetical protein
VPEIGGVDVHLGGDHDLPLARDRLCVIALLAIVQAGASLVGAGVASASASAGLTEAA